MSESSSSYPSRPSLRGRVALISGAGDGMGRAAAIEFAKEGANVVLFSKTKEKLEKVAEEIKSIGNGQCAIYVGDVCNESDHDKSVQLAISTFGSLHVAFNNAGILQLDSGGKTDEIFDQIFSTNTKSIVFAMKYQIPSIMKSCPDGSGSIINNSSAFSLRPIKLGIGKSIYSASKAAVNSLTQTMALEYGGKLRINAIAPGVIKTNIVPNTPSEDPIWKELGEHHIMNRCGEAEEVAKLVTFLASKDSAFITGNIIEIDGGMKMK